MDTDSITVFRGDTSRLKNVVNCMTCTSKTTPIEDYIVQLHAVALSNFILILF